MLTAVGVSVHRHDDRAEEESLWVSADMALMHQALLNVIRNAADAMSPCSHGLEAGVLPAGLTLDARRDGSQVVLTVRDTGPGIKETDIDRIFNPFFYDTQYRHWVGFGNCPQDRRCTQRHDQCA